MAAPSAGGITVISSGTYTWAAPTYPGVISAPVMTSSGSFNRIGWAASPSLTSGDIVGGRRTFTSRNMTNELFFIRVATSGSTAVTHLERLTDFGGNFTSVEGVMVALFDSSGNYRRWKVYGSNSPTVYVAGTFHVVVIDPSQTRTMQAQSATAPDLTAIVAVEVHVKYGGTTLANNFASSTFGACAKTGVTLSAGEIGDPVGMPTFIGYNGTLVGLPSPETALSFFPITIAADYANFDSNYLLFQRLATDGTDNAGMIHSDSSYGLYINAPASSTTIISKSLIAARTLADFKVAGAASGATIDVNATTLVSVRDVLFDDQLTASNVLISGYEEVTTGGGELLGLTLENGAAGNNLIIDDVTQFNGSVQGVTGDIVITLPAGNYNSTLRLDLPPNKLIKMAGGGGSYSFTGMTGGSSGNPVVFDATDAGDYVITIGANLIAAEADPVTSGTVDLIAPSSAVSITGLIATTNLKIYDTGTQTLVDGVDSSGTSFSFETGTVSNGYDIYFVKPGFVPGVVRNFIYPAGSATLPIEMVEDPAYQDTAGAFDFDSDDGNDLGDTSDIWINIGTPAAVRVQLATGNNLTLAAGITWRQLYSAIVEERYTNNALMPFNGIVRAVSANAGEYEMSRGAELADATSRNLMRLGGVKYLTTAGATTAEYMGIESLGNIAETAYYWQVDSLNPTTTNAIQAGPVNQLVQIFGDETHGDFDLRTFFKISARGEGRNPATYDLTVEQGISTLLPILYRVPLATTENLALAIDDTDIDANSDGTADVAPFDGMSLTWLTSSTPDWANATVYAPFDYVESASNYWITVEGGTSSGTGVADDSGVTWYKIEAIYDANGGDLDEMAAYLYWAQRQAVDIDAGAGNRTGKTVDSLGVLNGGILRMRAGLWAIDFDSSAQLLHIPVDLDGQEWPYPAPPSQIVISGLPTVGDPILALINLTTSNITYPTITSGGATIELDAATNYLFAADAKGFLRQAVTLPGNTPTFTFNLTSFRDLYESGTSRSADIAFNYGTLVVTISDGTPSLSFADVFRTVEDYLATESGVLFPNPPIPVVVDVGGGNGRNYLFFPYDETNDVVNPVTIKPDPTNTIDPTLTDFVIVLEGATAPLFDIFDFTDGGGRTIRFQTEAVSASVTVSGSGALTTEQANQLATVATRTARVDGLIENSSGDRFTAKALEEGGGGGGGLDAAGVRAAVGLASANLDTQLSTIDTVVDAILVDTAEIGAAGAGLTEAGGTGDHLSAIPTIANVTTVGTVTDKAGFSLTTPPLDATETQAAAAAALTAYDPPTRAELTSDLDEIKGVGFDPERDTLQRIYRDTLKRPFVGGDE